MGKRRGKESYLFLITQKSVLAWLGLGGRGVAEEGVVGFFFFMGVEEGGGEERERRAAEGVGERQESSSPSELPPSEPLRLMLFTFFPLLFLLLLLLVGVLLVLVAVVVVVAVMEGCGEDGERVGEGFGAGEGGVAPSVRLAFFADLLFPVSSPSLSSSSFFGTPTNSN